MKDTDQMPRFEKDNLFADQMLSVGNLTSGWSKTPVMGLIYKEALKVGGLGGASVFGYSSCQWLRHCDQTGEDVGSKCSSTLSNVAYAGHCFKSDSGSLECGRLTAMDDMYGDRPIVFDSIMSPTLQPVGTATPLVISSTPGVSQKAYRCPPMSPAKGTGTFVSTRYLSAGCMVSNDTNYDQLAEVHVPAYCASPMDFKPGCMIPSATNFDDTARQSSKCLFAQPGCMDSTAVNYNSEATFSDGSCIARHEGCTVAAAYMHGVDPDTPVFGVGMTVGTANFGSRVAVLNPSPDPLVNVNVGCIIALEGCMNPTAVNYASEANIQTSTICLPPMSGCMMPTVAEAGPSASLMHGGVRDGMAVAFNPAATVHDRAACGQVARHGCTDPSALNYDPMANVASTTYPCYEAKPGCLNNLALNFGCETRRDSPCDLAVTQVTVHSPGRCKYLGEPSEDTPSPPSPPPPRAPTGDSSLVPVTRHKVQVKVTVSGDPIVLQSQSTELVGAWSNTYGSDPPWDLEIFVPSTGQYYEGRRLQETTVELGFSRTYASADAAASAQAAVSSQGLSMDDMSSVFSAFPLIPLEASVETVQVLTYEEPSSSDGSSGALIGIIIGGVGGVIILVGLGAAAYIFMKRRTGKVGVTMHMEDD